MEKLKCSFCDKTDDQLALLIKQKNTYICNECVAICVRVLSEHITKEKKEIDELTNLIHLQEQG